MDHRSAVISVGVAVVAVIAHVNMQLYGPSHRPYFREGRTYPHWHTAENLVLRARAEVLCNLPVPQILSHSLCVSVCVSLSRLAAELSTDDDGFLQ